MKVKGLLFELEIKTLILELEQLLLKTCTLLLLVFKFLFELLNSLVGLDERLFSLVDLVHWLANQELNLMVFVPELLLSVLELLFKLLLFIRDLTQLRLHGHEHSLLKGLIDLLEMEYLILKLLDLIKVTLILRVLLHLDEWLGSPIDESCL